MMEYFLIGLCISGIFSKGERCPLWFIAIFATHFAFKYW